MSSRLHFLYGPKQQETRMHSFVYCEQSVLTESKTVRDAIIDLIATYYVFGIAYPKTISAIMLFCFSIVFLSFWTSK